MNLKLSASLALLCLVLCGCAGESSISLPSHPADTGIAQHYAPDGENVRLIFDGISQLTADGILRGGKLAELYDPETKQFYALCAQGGCAHMDGTCAAWLGGKYSQYNIYRNQLYALVEEDAGGLSLRHRALDDVIWETLWSKAGKPFTQYNFDARIGGGYFVLNLTEQTQAPHQTPTSSTHLILLNLYNLTLKEFDLETTLFGYQLYGATNQYCVLGTNILPDDMLPQKQYVAAEIARGKTQMDAVNAYFSYVQENSEYQYSAYNLDTGESTTIATGQADELLLLPDPNVLYHEHFYYAQSGHLMEYSFASGKSEQILKVPNVINVFAMDGRLFYITQGDHDMYQYFYLNLQSREVTQLLNAGRTDSMEFNIMSESEDSFLGNYKDGTYYISKVDFYSERYDRAVKV